MYRRGFGTVAEKSNSLVAFVAVKVSHNYRTAEFSVFRILKRITAVGGFCNQLFNFSLVTDCLGRSEKIVGTEIGNIAAAHA